MNDIESIPNVEWNICFKLIHVVLHLDEINYQIMNTLNNITL